MLRPAHSLKNYGTSISGPSYSDVQRLIPSRARSARQGEDQTVIRFRRGLDARSIPAVKFRIPDLMQVASRVMEQVNSHNPDVVFIDGTAVRGRAQKTEEVGQVTPRGAISPVAAQPCADRRRRA
jgi:hypothetical protein